MAEGDFDQHGGAGSEDAYAAVDVGVDDDGFVDDAEDVAVLLLVAAGDVVEVEVAAEGCHFEVQFCAAMEDGVVKTFDFTPDNVAEAVDAVAGEEYLTATVVGDLHVEVEIVAGGVLLKKYVVVDVEGEVALLVVGRVEKERLELIVVVDVGGVVEGEPEIEAVFAEGDEGVAIVVVGGKGVHGDVGED